MKYCPAKEYNWLQVEINSPREFAFKNKLQTLNGGQVLGKCKGVK